MPVDFKRLLIEDRDKFVRAFIEHLCTYGLRRVLTVDDQDDIKAIAAEAKKNQYRGQGHRPRRGPVRPDAQTLTSPTQN